MSTFGEIANKRINLGDAFSLLFCVFVLTKTLRGFSGASTEGGIWNVIQILFVIGGVLVFLTHGRRLKEEPAIVCILLFSCVAFLHSLLRVQSISPESLFVLLKTLYPAATFVLFYYIGLCKMRLDSATRLVKPFFYISAAVLIVTLGRHMASGGWRSSEAGSVSDVYYLLCLLPIVIAGTPRKRWAIPLLVTAIAVLFSQKRAGLIVFVLVIVMLYVFQAARSREAAVSLKGLVVACCLLLVGYGMILFLDANFNLNIVNRLLLLGDDGGSGRADRWDVVWLLNTHPESIFILLFGHGVGALVSIVGNAHNDFLQIWYEQGIVGLALYAGFFLSMFSVMRTMRRNGYEYVILMGCSLLISLFIASFSFYAIDSTYITAGCFVQGFFIADYRNSRRENENTVKQG